MMGARFDSNLASAFLKCSEYVDRESPALLGQGLDVHFGRLIEISAGIGFGQSPSIVSR